MYNTDTEKLIESLNLTRREELDLRSIAGLGSPEPRNLFERLLYSPLRGVHAFVALIVIIAVLAILAYVAWKLSNFSGPAYEALKGLALPILIFVFVFVELRRNKMILKLYRALERERASVARVEGE
jgi:hypothetical protein